MEFLRSSLVVPVVFMFGWLVGWLDMFLVLISCKLGSNLLCSSSITITTVLFRSMTWLSTHLQVL